MQLTKEKKIALKKAIDKVLGPEAKNMLLFLVDETDFPSVNKALNITLELWLTWAMATTRSKSRVLATLIRMAVPMTDKIEKDVISTDKILKDVNTKGGKRELLSTTLHQTTDAER